MMALDHFGVLIITDQIQHIDLKSLYGVQVGVQFKFWKIDDLIPSVNGGMADDNERINMALRQKSKANFRSSVLTPSLFQTLSGRRYKRGDL